MKITKHKGSKERIDGSFTQNTKVFLIGNRLPHSSIDRGNSYEVQR
jgi:hypothetical protein